MIRFDAERHCWVVDVSPEVMEALEEDWSPPMEFKVEEGMLIFRDPVPELRP